MTHPSDNQEACYGRTAEPTEDRLAGFVGSVEFAAIPKTHVDAMIVLIEDVVACMVSGAKSEECVRISETWHSGHGVPEASFVGRNVRGAWSDACFVNAIFAHWFEWDDVYDPGAVHASAVVFPVLLAAAERAISLGREINGREFMSACAAALEVTARLGEVLTPYAASAWMPTGFSATVGASAGAARLLGMSKGGILSAMGLAGTGVALSRQPIIDFVDGKNVLCGLAASRAAEAVRLADCGITGAPRFLSGRMGLNALVTEGHAPLDEICHSLGELYHIDKISLKPYPSCRSTHPAVDLALDIQAELEIEAAKIDRIDVLVPQPMADMCGAPFEAGGNPRVSAQFSLAYTVACAMVRQDLGIGRFIDRSVRGDEEVLRLAARVFTHPQPLARGKKPLGEPVTVKVTKIDGSTISKTSNTIKGSPERPMSTPERARKFDAAMTEVLCESEADILRSAIHNLDSAGPVPIADALRRVTLPLRSEPLTTACQRALA